MYYEIIEVRKTGIVYTGMIAKSRVDKIELLKEAKKSFSQYSNLQILEVEKPFPKLKNIPIPY